MKLPSKIKFADEKVKKAFEGLPNSTTEDKQLYKFLEQAFENLEKYTFYPESGRYKRDCFSFVF